MMPMLISDDDDDDDDCCFVIACACCSLAFVSCVLRVCVFRFFHFSLTEFVRLFCPTFFLRGARIADRAPAQREYLHNITNL